jgi:hypothetical protein
VTQGLVVAHWVPTTEKCAANNRILPANGGSPVPLVWTTAECCDTTSEPPSVEVFSPRSEAAYNIIPIAVPVSIVPLALLGIERADLRAPEARPRSAYRLRIHVLCE